MAIFRSLRNGYHFDFPFSLLLSGLDLAVDVTLLKHLIHVKDVKPLVFETRLEPILFSAAPTPQKRTVSRRARSWRAVLYKIF